MSGSWLGRGRVGRLVLLAGATITILFALFLYHSASNEMARLRDLHVKCAQQQEALAAQLQVLYEYKVQLEKTLSNEKSTNQAVKEELQQKASRERERDKNSREALQRYNSLQQNYKLLQTEHQDLKDDCKKKEDVALKNSKNLEETLQELRIELKKAADDKKRAEDERKSFAEERKTFSDQKKAIDEERKAIETERKSFEAERKTYEEERKEEKKTFEHMKNKYMVIIEEKEQLEENYNSLKKTLGNDNGNVERLQKQVVQLQRELDESRKSPHFSIGSVKPAGLPPGARQMIPRRVKEPGLSDSNVDNNNNNNNNDDNKLPGLEANPMQMMRPSSQQQPASSVAKVALPGLPVISSSKPSSLPSALAGNNRSPTKVKLPLGVPPIPRLIEPKEESIEAEPAARKQPQQQESAGQAPPLRPDDGNAGEIEPKLPKMLDETGNGDEDAPNVNARHMGEQILDRHEADSRYKLKPGVQEVGDPHHIEKSGFENAGGNEDVEQYDDYNSKELQNKNGDLHLEEGEDEREDEDYDLHNNGNAVKHE